jgi:cytoskeletal protein CcmA (bactofilin family)
MREIHGRFVGDVTVDADETTVHGTVIGHVVASEGARLVILGTVIGSVRVEANAVVHIPGVVVGSITSDGGRVVIDGVVEGAVAGDTIVVSTKAVVHDVTA